MSTRYHLHVYWPTPALRDQAMLLREAIAGRFPQAELGGLHERPVAFHPAPMFQVTLTLLDAGTLFAWLQHHCGDLSLMVHPLTDDVLREHRDQAVWLGPALKLDTVRLQQAISTAPLPPSADVSGPLLRIDASARHEGSVSRKLADEVVARLAGQSPERRVVRRELTDGVPLLNPDMLEAFNTPADERTPSQQRAAQASETLMDELRAAEHIVLALPIYNFGVPAAFKAWIDLVARARETFAYTDDGPRGLLPDRPVTIVLTSGGTRVGGELDFVTPWLRHVLGFIGLHDLHFVLADGLMMDPKRLAQARAQIELLAAV